jgi:predicted anti-sigma-YlaC factor YlaD
MSKFKPLHLTLITLALILAASGCSLQRMALDQTAGILKKAMPAFERDWDYDLVAAALPGNIKVIEGFLQAGPDNRDLLLLVSQSYTSYGLVVLEDEWERAEEDTPQSAKLAMRTREMYMRGHRYAMRLLEQRHPGISAAFKKNLEELEPHLARCSAEDVPGLFWSGMPLATAINMSRDDVAMIAYVPKAKALVARALELEEGYYHAGGHMIFGGLYGSMGQMLGGDPKKSQQHFDKALKLTKRKFLLVQVMYAKTLAVQNQDQKTFDALLKEVLEAKLEIFPAQKLANVAAKRRARRLLAKKDELF